ncbi:CopY/TcrY family copper transport repressor [Limosilactobacillus difficilis]|uniref:CopY/TcrY family copper transport repressor n=1 Tax=Limosilactobacillus difficilis TaxID=2991838 RepID=UPI0024B8E668|nr:CopY/TcrY family copper transport repressor [Limosilactobacillus difficilis]
MAKKEELDISPAEWQVMRVLWTRGSATSSELTKLLSKPFGWQSATVKTLLRRLVQKNILATKREGRAFRYTPLVEQQTTMSQVAIQLFENICAKRVGRTLADVIDQVELSQSDIHNLQALLQKKLQDAPEEVACNCIGCPHNPNNGEC